MKMETFSYIFWQIWLGCNIHELYLYLKVFLLFNYIMYKITYKGTEGPCPDAYSRFLNPSLAMEFCSKTAEHLWVALKPL